MTDRLCDRFAVTTRLNLRLLEVFRVVVDAHGVTDAAAKLGVTQPAISKAISQLERDLGYRLFGRGHGRLHPTRDAERLYAETERLFVQVATFQDRLTGISTAREGKLIVAAIPTLAASIVADAAARFGKTRPEVRIEVVAANAALVAESVGRHRCDLGLVHSPVTDKTVRSRVIGESEIVAVMRADNGLAGRRTLSPADLVDEPLILNDAGSPPTHLLYETFAAAHVNFRIAIEANSSAVGNAAARAGRGVALIDPWSNHPTLQPGLVLRRFRPRVPLRINLLTSVFRPSGRLAEAFSGDLSAVLREAARHSPFISAR